MSLEISAARSFTLWTSVVWLNTDTRSPCAGGLLIAISIQRTVSRMWMNALVWPPVP